MGEVKARHYYISTVKNRQTRKSPTGCLLDICIQLTFFTLVQFSAQSIGWCCSWTGSDNKTVLHTHLPQVNLIWIIPH